MAPSLTLFYINTTRWERRRLYAAGPARHVYATPARYGRLSLMEMRCFTPLTRLAAALIVAVVAFAAGQPSAQTVRHEAFTVSGVAVDVTAADASAARDRAIVQAQRKAWEELFKQLLPPGAKAPALSDVELSRAVQNFSIDDERLSPGRYAAVMTVRFAPEPVRQALAGTGTASYVEPATRPMVLLPLTIAPSGAPVLWDDRTPWRAAWEAYEGRPGALAPLTVPDGELSDVSAVSAQEAQAGDAAAFAKLAQQHGAGGVVVAKVALEPQGPARGQSLQVDVMLATLDGLKASKTITVRPDADDRPEDILSRAVAQSAAAVDELWRQDRTVSAGPQQTMTASTPLSSLSDWLSVRQKLAQLGGGTRVDMLSLTRTAATVSVSYRGGVEDLQNLMSRQGLALVQTAGGWVVQPPPPSLTPPTVTQSTPGPIAPATRP